MNKLEEMGSFFDSRLEDYDRHQLTEIEGAGEFYRFTAECLPAHPGARILDLGCGTGLELEEYFRINPSAKVTGIDLAPGMLKRLESKFPGRELTLILGSYFDVPFGKCEFDAAVSVESLHHFTKEEKVPLYSKTYSALRPGGKFVLTDYFSDSDERERRLRSEFLLLKEKQGIKDAGFYHFDTPLTVEHEIEALREGGFDTVDIIRSWGATHTLVCGKRE